MNITGVNIRKLYDSGPMRALVSVTVDGDFAVHDLKVIQGRGRLFVAMPSRKEETGGFRDIAHPIGQDARRQIEDAVLSAYYAAVTDAAGLPS